jgi:hypothetical protein
MKLPRLILQLPLAWGEPPGPLAPILDPIFYVGSVVVGIAMVGAFGTALWLFVKRFNENFNQDTEP